MTDIVGLCGNAGSGKDTAAHFLKVYGYKHMSFAWHIKTFVQKVFAMSDDQIWGPSEFRNALDPRAWGHSVSAEFWSDSLRRYDYFVEDFLESLELKAVSKEDAGRALMKWFYVTKNNYPQPSPRILLQTLGTEWGRTVDPDLWVNTTLKETARHQKVVISDVRFENEARAIIAAGGRVVRIFRESDTLATTVGIENHVSETQQNSIPNELFSVTINNTGTLLDMHTGLHKGLGL